MYAAWYSKTGKAGEVIELGQMEKPRPKSHEVLIKIKASGINPSDVKKRDGARGQMDFKKIIPHSDGSGIIESIGSKVSSHRINQRVWVWNAAWKRPFGTAAEYLTIPSNQAVELPENVSFEEGACIGIPIITAHSCFNFGESLNNKTVLVTGGAGVVSRYIIQIAKILGSKVITTVSSEHKKQIAQEAGADIILNYKKEDVVQKILNVTSQKGVDKIIDVDFGANLLISTKVLKHNCEIVSYGSMGNPNPVLPFYNFMFKGLTLRTIIVYDLDNDKRNRAIKDINSWLKNDMLSHNIQKVFSLKEIVDAHLATEDPKRIGSIVLAI